MLNIVLSPGGVCDPVPVMLNIVLSPGGVCDPVPVLSHAVSNTTNARNGSVVVYTCDFGFMFRPGVTNNWITCDGISWTETPALCIGMSKIIGLFI